MEKKYFIFLAMLPCCWLMFGCGNPAENVTKDQLKARVEVAQQEDKKSILELQEEVDSLIELRNPVQIRRNIKVITDLVDILADQGRKEECLPYLQIVLQHNAWNLKYQMLFADIMHEQGRAETVLETAQLVADHAETDELIDRARIMLGQKLLQNLPELFSLTEKTDAIVILAIGDIDRWLAYALADELNKKLGIPVYSQKIKMTIPPAKRIPLVKFISFLRNSLIEGMKTDKRVKMILENAKISEKDLKSQETVVEAVRLVTLKEGGEKALADLNKTFDEISKRDNQWDIEDIFRNFKKSVMSQIGIFNWNPNVYYVGLTKLDTFANESNYIFGTAENSGKFSVISYHRFRSDFTNEPPDPERLVERIFKQSLSSIGFMFGLPRCTTPTCARAYPHNLAEHDAKSKELCSICGKMFNYKGDGHI